MTFEEELILARPLLMAQAFRMTRNKDTAEDLVQDVMVKALTHRSDYAEGTNMRAWLCTIMRNHILTQFRKENRRICDNIEDYTESLGIQPDVENALELAETMTLIGELSDEMRESLMVRAKGFSYLDAADRLGIPVGTVKSRVARARQHILDSVPVDTMRAAEALEKALA